MATSKRVKLSQDMELTTKSINTIRVLAADMVQKANSGHPGAPMGCAPMAYALWTQVMNYNPSNAKWPARDRFVLSNGHACTLQYCMLHLSGYGLSLDDLKNFRQLNSKTPGHPENHLTDGIEVSTGPLGQGISNAVGLAICEAHLAATYNKPDFTIFDNYTYVICGDGCLQEGVSAETASLAGHLGLGKLIVLYDDNQIQIDGSTDLAFTEDVLKRYEAYGWHTSYVPNGDDDVEGILKAIEEAKAVTDKPSIIKVKTVIGYGSGKQGTEKVHGSPLGADDLKKVKKLYGFDPEQCFHVPEDVSAHFGDLKAEGERKEAEWNALLKKYTEKYPKEGQEIQRRFSGELPADWEKALPCFTPNDDAMATRKFSHNVLDKFMAHVPEFMGGCADLTPSTLTKVKANEKDFQRGAYDGNYLRFGVREHGMCAVANGMAAYGGFIPFTSTFLVFSGYALGAMRLSALSFLQVVFIYTHDSIGLGEDGPTHQPVETLATLRSIPNMRVIRPADGNEVSGAYLAALSTRDGPTLLALSRQNCPNLAGTSAEKVLKGAYPVGDSVENPQVILTGSGSEMHIAVEAAKKLQASGVKAQVVSFPCWELFEAQSEEYKNSVFPQGIPVLSIEAGSVLGWEKYAHGHIGMSTFGTSAPGNDVFAHFGFSIDKAVTSAQKLVDTYGTAAPSLKHFVF